MGHCRQRGDGVATLFNVAWKFSTATIACRQSASTMQSGPLPDLELWPWIEASLETNRLGLGVQGRPSGVLQLGPPYGPKWCIWQIQFQQWTLSHSEEQYTHDANKEIADTS